MTVIELAIKQIDEQIAHFSGELVRGDFTDLAEYKKAVGIVIGLQRARLELTTFKLKLEEEDEE